MVFGLDLTFTDRRNSASLKTSAIGRNDYFGAGSLVGKDHNNGEVSRRYCGPHRGAPRTLNDVVDELVAYFKAEEEKKKRKERDRRSPQRP